MEMILETTQQMWILLQINERDDGRSLLVALNQSLSLVDLLTSWRRRRENMSARTCLWSLQCTVKQNKTKQNNKPLLILILIEDLSAFWTEIKAFLIWSTWQYSAVNDILTLPAWPLGFLTAVVTSFINFKRYVSVKSFQRNYLNSLNELRFALWVEFNQTGEWMSVGLLWDVVLKRLSFRSLEQSGNVRDAHQKQPSCIPQPHFCE